MTVALVAPLLSRLPLAEPVAAGRPATDAVRQRVVAVDLLGEVRMPPGGEALGTPLGGLSAITYDAGMDVFFALSDDRGSRAPARFYQLAIAIGDGRLTSGDVTFTGVITLTDPAGEVFSAGAIDPEGLALAPGRTFFISSEGDAGADPPVPPFVNEFGRDGRQLTALPVPQHYLPSPAIGVRNNLAFEPLAVSGDGTYLLTGTENALTQDGPATSLTSGSWSRLLAWDLATRRPTFEHVYPVSPIPAAPNPANGAADNGLVEVVPLDNGGTLLAMERSYAVGVGNTVRLFELRLDGATDVAGTPALVNPDTGEALPFTPVDKRLVADIRSLGVAPDNIEGMALGPTLADGRRTLVLVSDDNFNPLQVTQFIALALRLATVPAGTCFLPLALRDSWWPCDPPCP